MDKRKLALKVEQLSIGARLSDLAAFMTDGEVSRVHKVYAVVENLDPGVYLIGSKCGLR